MPSGLVRYQGSGGLHFVTFSCYERLPLLQESQGYAVFLRELEAARVRYQFQVVGYVLMPEHVHLLLTEPPDWPLSMALQVLKQESSRELKGLERQFWQRRYYDFHVRTEEKRVEKLKYMHRNPVRRGLVVAPESWPWSSYRHYLTGERGVVEIASFWTKSLG